MENGENEWKVDAAMKNLTGNAQSKSVGELHAYASGSGALSFVYRDEDHNPTGQRPAAAECISFIRDKIMGGQGAWKDSEWVIVNQGPLDRVDHEKYEAVRKVERVGPSTLAMDGRVFEYDPAQVANHVTPRFSFDLAGQRQDIEGTGNHGALGYFLRNEKVLSNPDRVVWDSQKERQGRDNENGATLDSVEKPDGVEPLGPLFRNGQPFTFKVGDPVIGNGYRGTVTEIYSEQAGGGGQVNVRLPGGFACLSASFPDCYPALVNGVEIVADGRRVGKVQEVNGQFVTLDEGRGKLVAVGAAKFDTLPQVGEKIDVQVNADRAVVTGPKERGKGNER